MIISLGFELPRTSSGLPEDFDRASRSTRTLWSITRTSCALFLFGLAPGDAYHAGDVTTTAVGSYSTLSPLPDPEDVRCPRPSAVYFLWCWCRIAPPGNYPAPCPWSPDFPPDASTSSDHPTFTSAQKQYKRRTCRLARHQSPSLPLLVLDHSSYSSQTPLRSNRSFGSPLESSIDRKPKQVICTSSALALVHL